MSPYNEKKKIVILHVLASSLGGGASHVFDLITKENSEFDQQLAVSSDGGEIIHKLRERGQEVIEIDMVRGWKWRTLIQLIRFMRKYRPAIVHCHGFRAGLYGRLASKLAAYKIKTILTVHGFHFYYSSNKLKKKFLLLIEKAMSLLTDYVIAVSHTDRKHLLETKLITSEKSQIILNGINPIINGLFNKDQIRAQLTLTDSNQPIIATVARLHHQKGVVYFIQAMPKILEIEPHAQFLIVGDGPEKQRLVAKAIELNVIDHVSFLGNRADVENILKIVDVFVLASFWEGLPLSLLEAMRAEIPIVATDVDGNRDVIENMSSGILVSPQNSEEIAKAVIMLLQNPELARKLVKTGKRKLIEEFGISKMLDETDGVYTKLMIERAKK